MELVNVVDQLLQLPLAGLLIVTIFVLWRELQLVRGENKALQTKYENVLLEMGKLNGKVDTEVNIERKLEQILTAISKK